jgi:hypothetical protein
MVESEVDPDRAEPESAMFRQSMVDVCEMVAKGGVR